MSSTPVFNNIDGVDAPEGATEIGWTSQGVQLNPQAAPSKVFTHAFNRTPAGTPGWTVQSAVNGSNEKLVTGA